jgi:hypothetical protein
MRLFVKPMRRSHAVKAGLLRRALALDDERAIVLRVCCVSTHTPQGVAADTHYPKPEQYSVKM